MPARAYRRTCNEITTAISKQNGMEEYEGRQARRAGLARGTTHNHEEEQHASAKIQQTCVPHPHPPAYIGDKRFAAACKRVVGKGGATHRHQERKYVIMSCHAAHTREATSARAAPPTETGKNKWPSAREWLSRGANGPALRCNAGQP